MEGEEFNIRGAMADDDPIEIPIEETLDLHPFRPAEVRDVVREYLEQARAMGYREVRLIHGRGVGVQRANVQRLLRDIEYVMDFWDDAHLGATVVVMSDE
jgi:DNA-nicking Smr family endonuclease